VHIVKNPLILSETWRWDRDTDKFVDLRSSPPTRHPVSSFAAKVAVYEARVREWFLDLAQEYVNRGESPADYVALSIALAYVEGVEQYCQGTSTPQGQAGNWFKASALRIFPAAAPNAVNRLWKEGRCGLFHCGFPDGRTYLSHGYTQALAINNGDLQINPRLFVDGVCADFTAYVTALRASPTANLGQRFEQLWDHRWENS